jgi:hypothetical protein
VTGDVVHAEIVQAGPTRDAAANEVQRLALVHRLCLLQSTIARGATGHFESNDCFCRVQDGGYVAPMAFWRNTGTAVDFIEQAVAEKLGRIRDAKDSADAHIRGLMAELADQAGVTVDDLERLRGGR